MLLSRGQGRQQGRETQTGHRQVESCPWLLQVPSILQCPARKAWLRNTLVTIPHHCPNSEDACQIR